MEEDKQLTEQEEIIKLPYPLEPVEFEQVKRIDFKDWCFYFTSRKCTHSKQLEECQAYLGVQTIPEIFYGQNRLLIFNEKLNIALTFSPFDAMLLCHRPE